MLAEKLLQEDEQIIVYETLGPMQKVDPREVSFPQAPYQSRHRASVGEDLLFDVTYSIDQWGRRLNTSNPEEIHKSIALFGCSMVFGTGVDDEHTLASQLAKNLENIFVTTYSLPVNGPQHNLIDMYHRDFTRELPETSSPSSWIYVAFVGGTSGHPQRLAGHPQINQTWLKHLPYVQYNPTSKSLESSSTLYQEMDLAQKYLHKIFSTELMLPLTKQQWSKELLGISSKKTKQKFIEAVEWMDEIAEDNGHNFFVLFHPQSDDELVKKYQQLLQDQTKISVLVTRTKDYQQDFYRIPYDFHPTPKFNKDFAMELAQQIKAWEM